jgi:hypothetical protein
MREKQLGRWVVRLACATGVAAAVLGGSAVANAADAANAGSAFYVVPGQITWIGTTDAGKISPQQVYRTDDLIWQ